MRRTTISRVHATSVAWKERAVLLTGPPGSGKSDLALRLIDRGWELVADDYTQIEVQGDALILSVPETIAGKIELRGIGIVDMPHRNHVPAALVADLGQMPERFPEPMCWRHEGHSLPLIHVRALEPSAPLKIEWAMVQTAKGQGASDDE